MAVDKLVDSAQLDADLTTVANAIRTKGGTSGSLAFPAGFVSAIQAIPTGGGGSSWTKVCEKSYTRSTTSTSTKTIETWQTNHTEIWTSDKILYVRVRDTAGKRNNYYYGTDAFFYNVIPKNGESTSSISTFIRFVIKVSSSGTFQTSAGSSSVYGICPMTVYKDGRIQIQERYNSNTSGTINGTYKVEVYLLDPPAPIFG